MTMHSLTARLERMIKQIDSRRSPMAWSFVLLSGQEIPQETLARICPDDTLYIKRIVLTHLEQAA